MKYIIPTLLVALIYVISSSKPAEQTSVDAVEMSPHAEAIMLVMKTQKEHIREIDQKIQGLSVKKQEIWWHDVKPRNWTATRPFDPGYFNTTHWFNVCYKIDDKVVARWFVRTDEKTVKLLKKNEKPLGSP